MISGHVQLEQYNIFPINLAKGKSFLSRRSLVDGSVDRLAAIGVPATAAFDMSSSSRMFVMYWSCLIRSMRSDLSRSILHPSSKKTGPKSSTWKRNEKDFLKLRMKGTRLPTRIHSSTYIASTYS